MNTFIFVYFRVYIYVYTSLHLGAVGQFVHADSM